MVSSIGTEDFIRIRVGIGRPAGSADVVGYVLSKFSRAEVPLIETAVESTVDAVRMIVGNDIITAMNKYN